MRRRRKAEPGAGAGLGPNLLDMVPVRRAAWEQDDQGLITLLRERPRVRGPRSLGRWVSFMLAPARIRLDDVGSWTWLHLDGRGDVRELASELRAEFGDQVEPVHERLGQLIRILRREGFIGYAEPSL